MRVDTLVPAPHCTGHSLLAIAGTGASNAFCNALYCATRRSPSPFESLRALCSTASLLLMAAA